MSQTVPSCQALYKNSFTYHTVSTAPPNFEESFNFLGDFLYHLFWKQQLISVLHYVQEDQEASIASFVWSDADSVLAEREKEKKDVRVLVHCMTGVSR